MTAPLAIDVAVPDPEPGVRAPWLVVPVLGDPLPRHLFMRSVEWPEPVGPVLRPDRAAPPRVPFRSTLSAADFAALPTPAPLMKPNPTTARFAALFALLLPAYLAALVACLALDKPISAGFVAFAFLLTAMGMCSALRDCGVTLLLARFPRERVWGFESYCAGSCALNLGTLEVGLHYPAVWARWLVPALRAAGWGLLWSAVIAAAFGLCWAVVTIGGPA